MNESKINLRHAPGTLDPSYLLTFFIDDFKIGDAFTDWPRHITVIPWFFVREIEQTDADMCSIAAAHQPIDVRGSEQTHFGELKVCLVEPKDMLVAIHKAVYAALQNNDARFIDTTYFGDNYNPHVTMQDNDGLLPGDTARLTSFFLVGRHRDAQADRYVKTVLQEYTFNE